MKIEDFYETDQLVEASMDKLIDADGTITKMGYDTFIELSVKLQNHLKFSRKPLSPSEKVTITKLNNAYKNATPAQKQEYKANRWVLLTNMDDELAEM